MHREIQVVIAGAGVGGLSLAGFLRQAGLDPVVVERADGLDERGGALELPPGAMALLARLGVAADVREAGTTVTGWSRRRPDGTTETRLDAEEPGGFVAIPYGRLRERLSGALPDGSIRTGTPLRSFEAAGNAVVVTFANGVREQFDLVVGADGVRSRTRELLGGGPAASCGTRSLAFPLPPDPPPGRAIEVWTPEGVVFRALPAGDPPMGWLTAPTGTPGIAAPDLGVLADALEDGGIRWGGEPPRDAPPDGALPDVLLSVDPADVWCDDDLASHSGVRAEGRVALVGDAARARHRLAGVGPTLAIEDAAALASELVGREDALSARLSAYADRRRSRLRRLLEHATGGSPKPLQAIDVPFAADDSRILDLRGGQLAAAFGSETPRPAVDPLSG